MISIKRIYDKPAAADGYRVLVDRLWPRGVKRENAALDVWLKEVAPSPELRKWFAHDPDRWDEFQVRYAKELATTEAARHIAELQARAKSGPVTLLYATRDEQQNSARLQGDPVNL